MSPLFITALLWFGAIGCGLLAGLYFAFSTFIMSALGRIEQVQGVSAMNSINSTILTSLFMPFFYGTTLASLILSIFGLIHRGESGALAMLAGGLICFGGMFLCTIFFNVPLKHCARCRRSSEWSGRTGLGALSGRLDLLESGPDDCGYRRQRALR